MSYDTLRYNQVRQKSAHNAFQQQEGIYDQIVYWRIRSLELDLHRTKAGHGGLDGDWFVYHGPHNPNTTVHRLSDFLRLARGIRRAMPSHEVVTVFLDMRQPFHTTPSASQSGVALDRLLTDGLREDALFRPAALLGDAATLQEAVATDGWPTLKSLRGKFVFVLTGASDVLATYLSGRSPHESVAFLSAKAEKKQDVPGGDPDIVFFNMSDRHVKVARTVHADGLIGRAYYISDEARWKVAVEHDCHHLATDDINAREDPWSQTQRPHTGFPFQKLSGGTPSEEEPGALCGVWARSGDIWGRVDSFYFQHADCGDAPDQRYELYISGANSFGDDWLKGGVLARASLKGNAAYFGVFRIGEHHGLRVQYRLVEGGTTVAAEQPLGGGVLGEDTLMHVRLHVSGGGLRARAWGSVDGLAWTHIASMDFTEPLRWQGLGVSSHGESRGTKFLFGVPNEGERPPFTRGQLIGPRGDGYGGGGSWVGAPRWKVDGFG